MHSFKAMLTGTLLLLSVQGASAHCDTPNGPVIAAAKESLELQNPNPVLIWVQPKDEEELQKIFHQVLAVRIQSKEAKALADQYLFETAVRLHRLGEGECYTGVKKESAEEHFVNETEAALGRKSPDVLIMHLNQELKDNVAKRFSEVVAKQNYRESDVEAGREYVKAYVSFIHYIGSLYQAIGAEGSPPHSQGKREE